MQHMQQYICKIWQKNTGFMRPVAIFPLFNCWTPDFNRVENDRLQNQKPHRKVCSQNVEYIFAGVWGIPNKQNERTWGSFVRNIPKGYSEQLLASSKEIGYNEKC